jgi:hypothetical protein
MLAKLALRNLCFSKCISILLMLTCGYQQNKFGDQYKLFLLINPEDEKPVAVVIPRQTLQPETAGNKILFVPCFQCSW